jgi:hypothetical protein
MTNLLAPMVISQYLPDSDPFVLGCRFESCPPLHFTRSNNAEHLSEVRKGIRKICKKNAKLYGLGPKEANELEALATLWFMGPAGLKPAKTSRRVRHAQRQ